MTEEEKRLAGYLYKANAQDIEMRRAYSVDLSFQYNRLDYRTQQRERDEMIHKEMRHAGIRCDIKGPFFCDFWERVTIGNFFSANYNFTILAGNDVVIGNHVLIGPNVGIYAAGHAVGLKLRNMDYEYARPVYIGNSVWIGGSVSIMSGVSIGDGAIIGAGSVVIHDIPANVLAVGNPCRVVRVLSAEDDNKYKSSAGRTFEV